MKEIIEQIHFISLSRTMPPDIAMKRIHELCDKALGHDAEYHEKLSEPFVLDTIRLLDEITATRLLKDKEEA
jgi:hypothetical protein